jgi:autotransporter-associated beta strand protein
MNRLLLALRRWSHGVANPEAKQKRRSRGQIHLLAGLRPLKFEPLEERLALSTIYVDDSARGQDNGQTWVDAYVSLQAALGAAVAGDSIRVGQGVYKPTTDTDRTASFALKNGVPIRGGYAGCGAADPDVRDVSRYPSVLSGDIGTVGSEADNSYHVVVGNGTDSTALLDGFTITGGNANGGPNDCGGGMYNEGSSPTLNNCTFTANSASSGGGMCNSWSSPTLTNCVFAGNASSGMANYYSSPTLTNCVFAGNGGYFGAGIYNGGSSPTLSNCTLVANFGGFGGGVANYDGSSLTLINCTIVANRASGYGSGLCNRHASSATLTNCILWDNKDSTRTQIFNMDSTVVATYSVVSDGYGGTGCIGAYPKFVRDPRGGDYGDLRLLPTSPCIDAGRNSAVRAGVTTDLAGNPRFADVPGVADTGSGTPPIVDMGAYEHIAVTVAGTAGPDGFTLSLSADQTSYHITSPAGPHTYAVSAITSLIFTGGSGDDSLTVNCANGNPAPVGGLVFDAGDHDIGDSLIVEGTASDQDVTLEGPKVKLDGDEILTVIGAEFFAFALGGQNEVPLPVNGLVKVGPGTLELAGVNTYTGGTTAAGGTVEVTTVDALPAGGSLTIGAGATVILDIDLNEGAAASAATVEVSNAVGDEGTITPSIPVNKTTETVSTPMAGDTVQEIQSPAPPDLSRTTKAGPTLALAKKVFADELRALAGVAVGGRNRRAAFVASEPQSSAHVATSMLDSKAIRPMDDLALSLLCQDAAAAPARRGQSASKPHGTAVDRALLLMLTTS